MSQDFPEFYGCSVEKVRGKNAFAFDMPFPTAPKGRIHVISSGGEQADPQVVYDRGKQIVLENAAEFSSPDDKGLWQDRYEAHRARTYREMRARAEARFSGGMEG